MTRTGTRETSIEASRKPISDVFGRHNSQVSRQRWDEVWAKAESVAAHSAVTSAVRVRLGPHLCWWCDGSHVWLCAAQRASRDRLEPREDQRLTLVIETRRNDTITRNADAWSRTCWC